MAVRRGGEVLSDSSGPTAGAAGATDPGDLVLALGHRRLSIIDLSRAGHQPMPDESGRYWIVFNGEIYNYVELRDELIGCGCAFRSRTDTEVVLQAFIHWGADCLPRFNGMWALAIYDRQKESLFCARDRFGIKPFYYAGAKGRFAFGSEIKQLVALAWVGAQTNRARLADFFLWGLENHTDETFFARVKSLPGSHYVELTRGDVERSRFEPRRYWTPLPGEALADGEAITAFRDLLSDSVRLRLRSDVPVGVTLSGGLDSSSIVCLAGEHKRCGREESPLDAFNVEFDGTGYSERRFAEAAAGRAGAHMIVLRPSQADLARDWVRFVWHMEEPFGGLSYFSNFQIYRLIREHGIPVVLNGQGGDELLLGYERYRTYDTLFKLKAMQLLAALKEMMAARRHANMSLRMQLGYGLYFSLPMLRAARRRRLVGPILNADFFREHSGDTGHLRRTMLHKSRLALQRSELFQYQLPQLLRHDDSVSMAHSIETRLPFLDYRLSEFIMGQPSSLLLRDGWSKYILRQAMEGVLPAEVQRRTDKMGYDTPTGKLIRHNRDTFLPLLARHRDDPVLDVSAIERRFESQGFDERLLCSAVSYLSWKETFAVA
jgi:asparagine synthase (glutamine-hydrolysing)